MAVETAGSLIPRRRPMPWRDPKVRAIALQIVFVAVVAAIVAFLVHNTLLNIVVLHGPGAGIFNDGKYTNPKVEELTAAAAVEMDPARRRQLLSEAQRIHKEDFGHIPLHQQMLAWGVRAGLV